MEGRFRERMFNTPQFQALRREYVENTLARCLHLEQEAASLRSGGQADLQAIRLEIHKFRGSGGFYGFKEISVASAIAEDQLILVLEGTIERNDALLADQVDLVVASVRAAAAEIGLEA